MTSTSSAASSTSSTRANRSGTRTIVLAFIADLILVTGFAALGRASHQESVFGAGGLGLLETAWPFAAALAVAWLVTLAFRRPLAPLRTGVPIWLITVIGGMLLRAVSGQGTAVAFIIVATVTLLIFLVGWRAIAALVTRTRARSAA
ncbi:MAG TPA: DUF3054 domain-containing protein [Microbacteriaceae bacterium]|jgi:hypothetical protein|nr:DUF3054 domain-containing protein [Microbacteriaceae bacterium]HQX35788.1 DUF3054 domain-containing protein [Microbacteriaceae bacterium]HQZ47015.1 DUF3054 domain-containing protein [Microbacteriaceae bacterium]HRA09612.1 DUF3054 domain-containing protein [Microbacteriaceae bacterium]